MEGQNRQCYAKKRYLNQTAVGAAPPAPAPLHKSPSVANLTTISVTPAHESLNNEAAIMASEDPTSSWRNAAGDQLKSPPESVGDLSSSTISQMSTPLSARATLASVDQTFPKSSVDHINRFIDTIEKHKDSPTAMQEIFDRIRIHKNVHHQLISGLHVLGTSSTPDSVIPPIVSKAEIAPGTRKKKFK